MLLNARTLASLAAFAAVIGLSSTAAAQATCIDNTDSCELCADEQCPTETQACCDATGCYDLATCVLDNCSNSISDQIALLGCINTNCQAEFSAAGSIGGDGTAAAQSLATCLSGPLQTPPAGVCTECVDGFGTGGGTTVGAGGSTGQGGSTGSATGGSTGAAMGGAPGTGGAGTGGTTTSTGSGDNEDGDDLEVDDGCGCHVVGTPSKSDAKWLALLGLGAVAVSRRRRS